MNGNQGTALEPALTASRHFMGMIFELTKIHLSLYIALSAVFGHVLARNRFTMDSLILGVFVLILSAGSGILNNIQDREFDTWFPRTRNRCLVKQRIPLSMAGLMAMAFIFTGLGGLFFIFPGTAPAGLGVLAVICYNGLYTPLKKRSLAAIVPGTLCGMLPPAMGWVSVPRGMAVSDATGLFIVMAVFGLWQIPHFFIILLKQDPVNGKDLPYPCFISLFSRKEIKCQILIWTCLYSLGIFLFLLKNWIFSFGLSLSLCMVGFGLPVLMALIFGWKRNIFSLSFSYLNLGFVAINLSILSFVGIGILDRILM